MPDIFSVNAFRTEDCDRIRRALQQRCRLCLRSSWWWKDSITWGFMCHDQDFLSSGNHTNGGRRLCLLFLTVFHHALTFFKTELSWRLMTSCQRHFFLQIHYILKKKVHKYQYYTTVTYWVLASIFIKLTELGRFVYQCSSEAINLLKATGWDFSSGF